MILIILDERCSSAALQVVDCLFQVIAYAMKEYNWPLEKARSFVQRKRKCVNPNEGFLQQLQVYEGMLDAR